MKIFESLREHDYEQVIYCYDKASGLKAIIAIHDTTLGPALGGTRMWKYKNEEEALEDVLRLARGMTYKNAAAGLNIGGGKAVIIGDPQKDKSESLFRAFGRYVESLHGRYITAEDVGTTEEDMNYIHMETDFVTGTSSGGVGDPSPVTALGIYHGMKAAAKEAFGTDNLQGKTIAVQGVGQVAYHLCSYLYKEEADLIVTDINEAAVNRAVKDFNAQAVAPDEIYDVECDIYSPCALGGTLNDETIEKLKAKVVAGSANNQLRESRHGNYLFEKGIVYAPDYVINSGGVINVADELQGYDRDRVMKKVESIYSILENVFEISRKKNIPTSVAADHLAEQRIHALRSSSKQFLPNNKHILR
ncbi:Glu/Leu/Phe/Val family dehydrogenase [Pseudogracilibacillus sp. SO30301A]|uniref:Glu/Leu/Phe/Val family dehydrogenase n=1 Tax=Pseudogracilibacillus sp. SO30301A TaxID=3098291 RepID=UPI00300E554A